MKKGYLAVPVQTTVRVKYPKNRGVAFHFTDATHQANAEYVMNCLGYDQDQYYFYGTAWNVAGLKVLNVRFRGRQDNRDWSVKEAA